MRTPIGVAMAILVACAAAYSFSPRPTLPLEDTRIAVDRMHLNALARSKVGLVAGGELGSLLFSPDQGRTWQPASVTPQRHALITQIVFIGDLVGLAVGHEGWILRTDDGGRHWREIAFDQKNGEPLMSIAEMPSGHWLAVGAFGRMLRSADEGGSWERLAIDGVGDKHLNRIVAGADRKNWLIVGERGLVLRSSDGGESWTLLPPFYNGSLYGALQIDATTWVAHGMRGNVFRSVDGGASWTESAMPAPISTFAGTVTADGRVMLVGQGGVVLFSSDAGASFQLARKGSLATLMDIAPLADGSWLLASDAGLRYHDVSGANK